MTGFCHRGNRFFGQYLVPAKLNAFNSGVQDKLYETYKTDLSEKRNFDNEILRWQNEVVSFNWWKTSDTSHRDSTLQLANPDLYLNVVTIITILLTMPVSTATPERSFSTMRRVKTYSRLTFHDENRATRSTCPDAFLKRYTHWFTSLDSRIFGEKEQTSSFQISLSSANISDMFATNVSLVRSLRCCCCWQQPQLAAFC